MWITFQCKVVSHISVNDIEDNGMSQITSIDLIVYHIYDPSNHSSIK
jgi:hypothetical protein